MADKKTTSRWPFVISTMLIAAIVLLLGFFALSSYGERSGIEFSPDDFSMRRFDYNRIPLLNWIRRGIEYDVLECPTGATLVADDWVRVTGRTPKRWHLVHESSSFSSSLEPAECDARFLTEYFDFTGPEGDVLILKWTDSNPKSAKVLWPLIAELARGEVYLPIPGILEFALAHQKADADSDFLPTLKQAVADGWADAARSDQNNEQHALAVIRFDKAIAIGEQTELLESAREQSKSLLGDKQP